MGKKNKIILIPRLNNPGGIANYYSVMRAYLDKDIIYIYRGKNKVVNRLYRMLLDFLNYQKHIYKIENQGTVLFNSSLGYGGLIRDGLYMLLTPAKIRKVVFFRGWDPSTEAKIDNSKFIRKWVANTFLKADHVIVLSEKYYTKLREWGYKKTISIESTVVDEDIEKGFANEKYDHEKVQLNGLKILYLGRIVRAKGVWEIVKTMKYLRNKVNDINVELTIAGDGKERESLEKYTVFNGLNVRFTGNVCAEYKKAVFRNAHIYVFPSNHGEGMPNSVLEAMAFGLPVITTQVGGLSDFFEDCKMGLIIDSREPEHIAEKIRYLCDRPYLMKQISEYNYKYAMRHFYSSRVAMRLSQIIRDVSEGRACDTQWWSDEQWGNEGKGRGIERSPMECAKN